MDRLGGPGPLGPLTGFLPSRDDSRKPKKTDAKPAAGFLGLLRTREQEAPSIGTTAAGALAATEAELESLLDEVHLAGEELARYPNPENVIS